MSWVLCVMVKDNYKEFQRKRERYVYGRGRGKVNDSICMCVCGGRKGWFGMCELCGYAGNIYKVYSVVAY